ncbi:Hypothetical protein, conserved [Brucella intermedia LMG 3301]|uniref:Uncharacterized protein n=5 Tax=Brucella/Ochrobactrum group TaxID=2826938 RepID=C4WPF0_9HYPH|nr:Hypothetical protein, conserved [Brucella intermedia LMG 3301]BBA73355.1 hydrolase [Ochrobactrum sp. PW1]
MKQDGHFRVRIVPAEMQNAHRYALWERAEMSNILFWTALVIVPVLLGTAYAYLQSIRHRDDF